MLALRNPLSSAFARGAILSADFDKMNSSNEKFLNPLGTAFGESCAMGPF